MPISFSRIKTSSLGSFSLLHLGVSLVANLLALCAMDSQMFQSFVRMQVIFWISLLSIILSSELYFLKKNVALLISVIVLKWPILVYVVYKMMDRLEVASGIVLGIVPLLLSILLWSILQKRIGN